MTRMLALAARTIDTLAPAQAMELAARTGFDAIGVLVDPATWTAAMTRDVRAASAATGIAVLDVEPLRIKPGPLDPAIPRILDIAAEIGASNALCIGHDADKAHSAALFHDICILSAACGIRPAIEFMAFRGIANLADAVEVVTQAGHPAGAILPESQHLSRSGGTPADLALAPPGMIAYAQICDAPAAAAGDGSAEALMQDALTMRELPGRGGLPLAAFVAALPPQTPLSVELIGDRVRARYASPFDFLTAIRRSLDPYLDAPHGTDPLRSAAHA